MRRLLIVSPRFPPTNAADAQRVRQCLPYFRENGWEPTVLAVRPDRVPAGTDERLLGTLPPDVPVVRTGAWPLALTRRAGLGSLSLRAMGALRRAGDRVLAAQRFDLVFFSTTEFPVLRLGLRWRRRFGVPYVADWQDPWWTDYYDRHPEVPRPGGRWRFALSQWVAKRSEEPVVRGAAGLVTVSSGYTNDLAARYAGWQAPTLVLPFGAPELDFELLPRLAPRPPAWLPRAPAETWLYLGRGGHDLHAAARLLFDAVRRARERHPSAWSPRRIVFAGTSYAPPPRARPTLAPLAASCGVGDLVTELPERVPYFDGLAAMRSAARLLVLGSDDAHYTASKLLPCLLAGRPVLAILHADSEAAAFLRRAGGARLATFRPGSGNADAAATIERWTDEPAVTDPLDPAELAPLTARAATARLAAFFVACVAGSAEPKDAP